MTIEHLDVLVVGAGISGIGAGFHLQRDCPGKTYAILEGRDVIGGTWDLFRYPGIRSDSDMYTLGFSFRPWKEAKSIADAPSILNYLHETAEAYGIDRKIRYRHMVKRAAWSSEDAKWTVEVEKGPEKALTLFTCNFLFMCSGYYDYAEGYSPAFPGSDTFAGQIIHPQHWPERLDYAGKKVVVIGSGATAVTIVPEMAKTAGHVTMLQRSPSYVVARPAEDAFAIKLRRNLPAMLAYRIIRWRNVLLQMFFFNLARKKPAKTKERLINLVRKELPDYDVDTHFNPRYNPWDQRLCLVPDSDLFEAIKSGKASVVTNQIETFTKTGIALKSGEQLDADIIVTATGLNLQLMSGLEVTVDGEPIPLNHTTSYKGMMYSGVPNLASSFGYTNASWTLKADLTCEYICRLINRMDKTGTRIATPRLREAVEEAPWLDFTSGYVQRGIGQFPKQGSKAPWKLYQNYILDLFTLRYTTVDDGVMEFAKPHEVAAASPEKVSEAA
ncbi:NAD(P)/FAD-dependent oxidoreductase [soil metagenome]